MPCARILTVAFYFSFIAASLSLRAQTPDDEYEKQRASAIALFRDHKDFEALPLLEVLAKQES
jgi:hypothetical protein